MEGACVVNAVFLVGLGMAVGFFACSLMAMGHISTLEHTLWHFSRAENWKRVAVDGRVAYVWSGGCCPRELAVESLR
jgi:hypothetical protein